MTKINENYLSLVIDHTCWQKAKKFRKESANFLKKKQKKWMEIKKKYFNKKKINYHRH